MTTIEKVVIDVDLAIMLDEKGISINKVLKSVYETVYKQCGEDLEYLDKCVTFYGDTQNVCVNYELYYSGLEEQIELKLTVQETPF